MTTFMTTSWIGILLLVTNSIALASDGLHALVDEHGCVYDDSQTYLSYCADEGRWFVRPSNFDSSNPDYGLVDADRLQTAINSAAEGETVVVMAGTWVFDSPHESDFDIHTATESFKHYGDFLLPLWDWVFATPVHHQDINIETVGVTITGETAMGPYGERILLTTITTSLNIDDNDVDWWSGYNGSFLINAPYVTLENLRVEKFVQPVWAYSPGFDIKQNEFINCGMGHYLAPNVELTYPNWPDTSVAIRSLYRRNTLINNAQPPHIVGSEVTVRDNYFNYRGYGLAIFPWGDLNDPYNFYREEPYPINWDYGWNNVVRDNTFDCGGGRFGVVVENIMSDLRDNRIVGNDFENCEVGVYIADFESSPEWNNSGTTVRSNTFRDIPRFAINPFSYVDPDGVANCDISGNIFDHVGYDFGGMQGVAIWAETGVASCQLKNNDYVNSGLSLDILFDGWFENGVYYGPSGNLVNERNFADGTTLCNQFYDSSMNEENPYDLNQVVGWQQLCGN
jgi:hypothetical protein